MAPVKMYYKIVQSNTPNDLEKQVSKMLIEGWKLWGSPFISQSFGTAYCQAMEKRYAKPGPGRPTGSKNKKVKE